MGLGAALTRATQTDITVAQTDLPTGVKTVETFTITDLSPSWTASGHYRGGMGIPAAARAAEMLADLVGGLTWDAYRDDPAEDLAHKVYPRPLLLEQPSPPSNAKFGPCHPDPVLSIPHRAYQVREFRSCSVQISH
jgi:hypothetical protein